MALRDPNIPLRSGPGAPPPEERDAEIVGRPPWISYGLIAACVAWYVTQVALALSGVARPPPSLMLSGPLVRDGDWWRVLLCALEHGGPLHLLFNMSAVWTLGRVLEVGIGTFRMAITCVVGALGSALFVLYFDFDRPTVGASGMILSWAGAILPIASRHGRRAIGTWLLQVAVISFLPGVSWAGHLGGFLFGLPCGWAMRGGPERFGYAAPVLIFISAVLVFLVGSGRV